MDTGYRYQLESRGKIFVRLSEPHIYIVVLTDGRESATSDLSLCL